MDVRGHAAIVTGAGSGLGAETARHLARAGAKVAVLDVNMEGAEQVATETGGLERPSPRHTPARRPSRR